MNNIINAWGKKSVHTMTALTALACMGLLNDEGKNIIRVFSDNPDFPNIHKFKEMMSVYSEYYCVIFNKEESVIYNPDIKLSAITVGARPDKNKDERHLALGIEGVDTEFENIYRDQDLHDVRIINCGDICSDPIAMTFIPSENKFGLAISGQRFNVLSGPYGRISKKVRVNHSELYEGCMPSEIDVYDIPKYTDKLTEIYNRSGEHERDLINSDILLMSRAYSEAMTLSGKFGDHNSYFENFVENLMMLDNDVTTFVSLNTDGKMLFTTDNIGYLPEDNEGCCRINIVDLINALSIIEISRSAQDSGYEGGGVYSFASRESEYFFSDIIFDSHSFIKFNTFIVTGVIIHHYVCGVLGSRRDGYWVEVKNKLDDIYEELFLSVIDIFRECDIFSERSQILAEKVYEYCYSVTNARPENAIETIKEIFDGVNDIDIEIINKLLKEKNGDNVVNCAYRIVKSIAESIEKLLTKGVM